MGRRKNQGRRSAIPDPTPLNAISWEADEDVVCIPLIPVELPGRAVRVNISLD